MTDLQLIRIRALSGIRRAAVPHENSFLGDMKRYVETEPARVLTQKQVAYLEKLAWKYRGQLKTEGFSHVVPAQSPFDADNSYTNNEREQ